jgi:hypothetical protein
VPAIACDTDNVVVPEHVINDVNGDIKAAIDEEQQWLDKSMQLLTKEKLEESDLIAWAAHHG